MYVACDACCAARNDLRKICNVLNIQSSSAFISLMVVVKHNASTNKCFHKLIH